ncbi:MAG: response regulator transcription factor [Bacteroidota bacterium]|nr:response regulator transcription factor [Bacteroidota bacterium]
MKNKILFIEDQEDLGNVIKQYLEVMDFEVVWCTDGKKAYRTFTENPMQFHLLIIDIQLPGMNGFDLAEKITREHDSVPFLFLTARNEKKDRIRGLKIGADDYISKPFDIDELVLRIRNIIRRNHLSDAHATSSVNLACGDVILNKDLLKLTIAGSKQILLTLREAELLEYLCRRQDCVLKREDILTELWGENDYFLGRSLDVFISRLRKLLSPSERVSIDNVYGIGFILNVKK